MAEYIEREAAIDRLEKLFQLQASTAKAIIDAIPAADVQPVRHGRWTDKRTIEHDGEWYCSECNKEITIYMGPDRKDRYAYCPNCGARMDKGEQ